MNTLLSLFGRSPFVPLHMHMEKVALCVHKLQDLFSALEAEDYTALQEIQEEISKLEHEADITKNEIRSERKKGVVFPISHENLFAILGLQDDLADCAEDIAVLVCLKELTIPKKIKESLREFLAKNLETFDTTHAIVDELPRLLETGFGGSEAEYVRGKVDQVAYQEHEADLIQRTLMKGLFASETEIPYSSFHLWLRVAERVGHIADLCENLANRMCMTLEKK